MTRPAYATIQTRDGRKLRIAARLSRFEGGKVTPATLRGLFNPERGE